MQLHLLSSPGENPIRDVVEAVASYLRALPNPRIAYLPAASDRPQAHYLAANQMAFAGLAEVELVDLVDGSLAEALHALSQCSMVYVPGGNTYLLASRLRSSGLFHPLATRLRAGLPLVSFSAGTVMVGRSIAMSNDQNVVAEKDLAGIGLVPYAIAVHYPVGDTDRLRSFRQRLREYRRQRTPSVLALADGAYLRAEGGVLSVVRGTCHLFDEGEECRILDTGTKIDAAQLGLAAEEAPGLGGGAPN